MFKKIFLLLFCLLMFCSISLGRAKYQGVVEKGGKNVKTSTNISYKLQETYPNSTVTVYRAGTIALATIYSNNSNSIKSNPFVVESDASYFFYADDGRYDIKFSGTGITTPFTKSDILLYDSTIHDINPYAFGAYGTNSSHTISSGDITAHSEWVKCAGNYVVGDQWDYVALQEAVCKAFYNGTTTPNVDNQNLNRPLHISAGFYKVNKPVLILKLKSGIIYGDGQLASKITTTADVAALTFNGLWYTTVKDISLYAGVARSYSVLDIDGNYDGINTLGVQGNTFDNILVSGNNQARYAVSLLLQGGSGAQGDNNHFSHYHFSGATEACYYQNGFNALTNDLAHGDMQSYSKHGILIIAGSVYIEDNTFESTYGYTQILNNGWDIDASAAGVNERIIVIGNRSESNRFYHGGGSQVPLLIGNQTACGACTNWSTTSTFTLNQITIQTSVSFGSKLYRVSTAGTSGGVLPIWPNSGTILDGTVTWTETEFDVVNAAIASELNNTWIVGNVRIGVWQNSPIGVLATDYVIQNYPQKEVTFYIDSTVANRNIIIGSAAFVITDGQKVSIVKTDTSAHTVTVTSTYANGFESGVSTTKVIPGGTVGYLNLQFSSNAGASNSWWVLGKSF